jgi:hypothetical protein
MYMLEEDQTGRGFIVLPWLCITARIALHSYASIADSRASSHSRFTSLEGVLLPTSQDKPKAFRKLLL